MKKLRKIGKVVYWVITVALILIAGATAFSVLEVGGIYRLFVVQSGSMEPKIKTGSVVLVVREKNYKVNDIITFLFNLDAKPRDLNSTITHRIFSLKDSSDGKNIETKGDANQAPDKEIVKESQILGKVVFSVPYLGYVVAFARTQTGLILLIVIPATIIIYSEAMNIKNEITRIIKEKKAK
ncbi:signal peptidase I [Candidatus Woesebacteria bacterium RIFOXYA1_FULL_40_18]|uniref:Signal peptidase I n=2 Tax=Candidatus Woeseibacteriota TaxID=1752722 RepID=A0A1F8CKZ1_9BACT|nr:MAG: signal peptidase I [Candidatus Woesebacteria bacterium RIFOXYA1_FULL_40_18]OGM80775.1 MAG: signal peptidase I [Candidatus Woesebacteria bacterium RIFOXYB1_FULL_40_26]